MAISLAEGMGRNQILAGLPPEECLGIQAHLKLLSFSQGDVLYAPGEPIRHVYFPIDAVIALIAFTREGRNVVVTLVGYEGLLGTAVVLGGQENWNNAVVHIPGQCLEMDYEVLCREFVRRKGLHSQINQYIRHLMTQISQNVVCNRVHHLRPRLARWLLMVHERSWRDEFPLTHDRLSEMLGAPRAHITLAAQTLRTAGLIHYIRGQVRILDREGLESIACECYEICRLRWPEAPQRPARIPEGYCGASKTQNR